MGVPRLVLGFLKFRISIVEAVRLHGWTASAPATLTFWHLDTLAFWHLRDFIFSHLDLLAFASILCQIL